MVEFAIIAPVFLLVLFMVFQVAYDQYLGVVLQSSVQNIAHQIEIGAAAGDSEANFLTKQYCTGAGGSGGLLGCSNLFLRIQHFDSTNCTDVYNATQGTLPVVAGVFQLGLYFNQNGAVTGSNGGQAGPVSCTDNASTAFCDAGPNQTIILTGVYLSPSLILGLIPGTSYLFNNSSMVGQIASIGFQTENFTNTVSTC